MRHRTAFSPQERSLRSQLHHLLEHAEGFARGSLIEMARCCGHPRCRCVLKGQKHTSLYLGQSQQGAPRMQAIPKSRQPEVRRWVANFQQARALLEALSQQGWSRLAPSAPQQKRPRRKDQDRPS